jgi:hypothetical protein
MPTVDNINRYQLTKQHVDETVTPNVRRYGTWVVPDIDMTNYTLYQVTDADLLRIDYIAYKTLGDSTLWWAIARVNHIANPFADLEAGMTLKIPTKTAILAALAVGETE